MKVFNVILSILVLILAIALAVSSYFLYEKREIMLNGWQKLSSSIHETAKSLDNKSATTHADSLTPDALDHTKYSNLDQNLKLLVESANSLNQQRDQYIQAMQEIGRIVSMSNLPDSDALSSMETSDKSAQAIKNGVYAFKGKNDALANAIDRTSKKVGVNLNLNELKTGNPQNALNALNAKLDYMNTQISNYSNANRELAQYVGVKTSNSSDIEATKKALADMKKAIEELRNNYNTSQKNLTAANNKIKSLENTIKARDSKIKNLNTDVADTVAQNDQLKVIIGMDNDNVVTPWADGSDDARKLVKGSITDINTKFGFAIANIGKNTKVQQRLGNKIGLVDPKIETGLKFNIVRGLDTPNIKVIASGVIAGEVADECTILEINIDSIENVKVGDTVIVDFTK